MATVFSGNSSVLIDSSLINPFGSAGNNAYKSIFENTGTSMFIVENDMTVSMVNEKFVHEFGYLKSEIEGQMKWTELVAPESLEFMIRQHKLRRETPDMAISGYEFKYKTKSGEIYDGVISVSMLSGTDKSIASVTDISELKKIKEEIISKNEDLMSLNEELAAINEEFEAANEELIHTNTQLEENELRYRTLFENTGSGIIVIEEDTTVSLANENFASSLGYTRDEIENKMKWPSMVCEEDLEFMKQQHYLRRKYPSKAKSSYEFRFKNKSGELRDNILFISMIPGTKKSIASLFDITDRKEAEKKLRISEKKYRSIFENIQDVFYQTDHAGIITEISPSIERYSGFKPEELIGKSVFDVYYDLSDRENFLKMIMANNTVIDFELRLKTKDNRLMICSTSSHLVYGQDGIVSGFEGILRDITERKHAEEMIREAEQKYRTLIENLNEIIYRLDDKAVIRYISPNIEMLFGYKSDEVIGRNFVDFVHPDDIKGRIEQYQKILSGIIEPSEYRFIDKKGNSVWVRTCATPVKDKGRITGLQGVLTDITDLKMAEAEKTRIEKDLFRVQKMEVIGTLAGGIAHNFNNILMGIMGYTSLLISEKDYSHPDYEYLKSIEEAVKSATELTKNLLGFARGGKYEVKPTSLNELLSNEIKIFSQTRKDVVVYGKYEKSLHMVDADQGQLRQVFLNLFINAWQAMPGGGNIYVNTSNAVLTENDISAYDLPSGRYVKISVTDTGTGIDKKILDNIFTPFFSTKDIDEGTGLGLASVYGIVTNHGGIIKAYSEKGKGTTFDIFLPASKTESLHLSHEESRSEDLIMGEGTILLVDDEKSILVLCEKMLKHLGYKTIKCENGQKALEYYSENITEILLIILDMTMPEMSGGETFDRIKQINPEAMVLLASGYAVDGEAQEILNRGCSGFIQKPFTITELSKKISETLQNLKN